MYEVTHLPAPQRVGVHEVTHLPGTTEGMVGVARTGTEGPEEDKTPEEVVEVEEEQAPEGQPVAPVRAEGRPTVGVGPQVVDPAIGTGEVGAIPVTRATGVGRGWVVAPEGSGPGCARSLQSQRG